MAASSRLPGAGVVILLMLIFLVPRSVSAVEVGSKAIPIDEYVLNGIHLLYNHEFGRAENRFLKVIKEKPKDPIGFFYLAMVSWSRLASGYWSQDVVRRFGERIDDCIFVARRKIRDGRGDSYTFFYLGGALGYKARFRLMTESYLSSFFLAVEAVEALKTCKKMDPLNKDVLFGIGIFDYYTAKLSGVLKFLSYLLIHKGDKEEGLIKIKTAAEEARYSIIEANSLLLHINLFMEDRFQEARLLAVELADRFRQNPRYRYLQGVACIRLGLDAEYHEVLNALYQGGHTGKLPGDEWEWDGHARYLEATFDLYHQRLPQARSKLEALRASIPPGQGPFLDVWSLLKIGMSHDLKGDRVKAMTHYDLILKLENPAGAQFLAKKLIDEPPKKDDPFLGY